MLHSSAIVFSWSTIPKAGVIMIADDFFEQMVEMTELRHLGVGGQLVKPSFMWNMSKVIN